MTAPIDPTILRALLGDVVAQSLLPGRAQPDATFVQQTAPRRHTAPPKVRQRAHTEPEPVPELTGGQKVARGVDLVLRMLNTSYDIARTIPESVHMVQEGRIGGALVAMGLAALPGPNPKAGKKVVDVGSVEMNDLMRMEPEELATAVKSIREYEKRATIDVFGEKTAKEYDAAQRVVNSSFGWTNHERYRAATELIDRLEAGLTPQQQKRLFGIGGGPPSFEEVSELGTMAAHYSPTELAGRTSDELMADMLALVAGQRRSGDPVMRYGVPRIYQELASRGVADTDILEAIGSRLTQQGLNPNEAASFFVGRLKPPTYPHLDAIAPKP